MRGAHASSARQQAAIAISKQKKAGAAKRTGTRAKMSQGSRRGRFPGDVNRDGKINAKDFRLARATGMI